MRLSSDDDGIFLLCLREIWPSTDALLIAPAMDELASMGIATGCVQPGMALRKARFDP